MGSWYTVHTPQKRNIRIASRGEPDNTYDLEYGDPAFFRLQHWRELPFDGVRISKVGWQHHWLDPSLKGQEVSAVIPPQDDMLPWSSTTIWDLDTGNLGFGHDIHGIGKKSIQIPARALQLLIDAMSRQGLILPFLPHLNMFTVHADRSTNLRELLQPRSS